MIGAIFGDIVGSVYEFHNIKTKRFELFEKRSRFTDDTVMTLAVASALTVYDEKSAGGISDLALFKQILVGKLHEFGEAYPDAGYGGRFFDWLAEGNTVPYNSFGNGSAMRVSPVVWYANSLDEALALAKACAEVTHNHPEGVKGAVVTAGAAYLARKGAGKEKIKAFVSQYYDIGFTLEEIRPTYTFNETCQGSVPQAMVAFLESDSFEDAIRNAVSIGGDSDTLGAIAGAVAEAFYGMDKEQIVAVVTRLDQNLIRQIKLFQECVKKRSEKV